MSHGDSVTKLPPPGFSAIGTTSRVPFAAVTDQTRNFFGLLFHPEADHTQQGNNILTYFAEKVCKEKLMPLSIDPRLFIEQIRQTVGKEKIICAVSGGVDSTVAAALIGKAIGKQLIAVYVESGLMRQGTIKNVRQLFTRHVKTKLVVIQARKRFLRALKGITDPEKKRKAIGKLYIDIFSEEAKKHRNISFLGQGTIYSDVIESKGSKHASKIKSHHNVGGLPKGMKMRLIEPLRTFYKDEVRVLGRKLGIPEEFVKQRAFPGPGYAIRIRGEVTEQRLAQEIQADNIVVEELKRAHLYDKCFQCFAVMTGAYSTAVKGDARVFAEVVAVRA